MAISGTFLYLLGIFFFLAACSVAVRLIVAAVSFKDDNFRPGAIVMTAMCVYPAWIAATTTLVYFLYNGNAICEYALGVACCISFFINLEAKLLRRYTGIEYYDAVKFLVICLIIVSFMEVATYSFADIAEPRQIKGLFKK